MLLPDEFQRFLSFESLDYYHHLPGCTFGDFLRARPKLQVRNLLPGQLERIFDYVLNERIVLEEISMGNGSLAGENVDKWAEYLLNHQLSYNLKILKFQRESLSEQKAIIIFDALVGHPTLQMIRFGNKFKDSKVLQQLARVLDTVPNLVDLDINFCLILDFPSTFTTALQSSKTLNRLTFYSCSFTSESSTALYDVLVTNKYIQFLNIGELDTDPDSYIIIMKGIDSNSTLNYFLADPPDWEFQDDFKSILERRKNLILPEGYDTSGLYIETDDYEDILVTHEDFCEERDELCAKLLTISRNLMLLDFPIEIKYHCLDMVMENYIDIDHGRISRALLDRNFIGKINAADARKLIQSCYP